MLGAGWKRKEARSQGANILASKDPDTAPLDTTLWTATGLLALVALVGGLTKAFIPKEKLEHLHGAAGPVTWCFGGAEGFEPLTFSLRDDRRHVSPDLGRTRRSPP